ncbi:hypothetical protein BDM02DRAFT_3226555 [Thelephora ganbajun]|uniref:Uncharacterized protein n=1 Tax=Thelephora ganbajun TaxID=370292 RepID=A0ACB6ZVP9_THEGA|nr:hypothetical protein BDM02DRAFT_3226555 [Thelephora ganbajun]
MQHLNVRFLSDESTTTHSPPRQRAIPVPFSYTPSDDGVDENLLILLHGLGDTHVPFANLGKQLKLPQTATLAIRAPEKIPYLYEEAFQWYESFDSLGDLLPNPNPAPALDLLTKIFDHLINNCGWSPQKIHIFGFAQGGIAAVEFALLRWRQQLQKSPDLSISPLGSVVSVCGPLLSYPTLKSPCPIPLLLFHRSPPAESALSSSNKTAFRKGFGSFREAQVGGEGMPRSKTEWEHIMRFWSERLNHRQTNDLYEVV